MDIGIAFNLRSDFAHLEQQGDGPEDRLEEYDSEATVEAIAAALRALGHQPRRLGGGRGFLQAVLDRPPQLVFNIAEGFGTRSREAHVPSVLEMLGVPYTHSDPLTLALTLDKAMAKRVVASMGVPTPAFAVVGRAAQAAELDLRFPVFAKPVAEGSSMGVRSHSSKAADRAALARTVESLLADYRQPVLVEEFCPGPEFTVGLVGIGEGARVLGVMEIAPRLVPQDQFVYSLEVKHDWERQVEYFVPPSRPAALIRRSEQVALDAYRALGCRDISRVDLRVDAAGEPRFLEVNPLPGINPVTGDIVIIARRMGVGYEQLIGAIVDEARARLAI